MRIFVGGASGTIGAELLRQGHTVTGVARSEAGAAPVARLGYGTRLRGATNAKAKKILTFAPRRRPWPAP